MYDSYSRYIYEWLINTFYSNWQTKIDSIIAKIDSILTVLQWGLYLGIFAFFFWILYSILKPHLFKV